MSASSPKWDLFKLTQIDGQPFGFGLVLCHWVPSKMSAGSQIWAEYMLTCTRQYQYRKHRNAASNVGERMNQNYPVPLLQWKTKAGNDVILVWINAKVPENMNQSWQGLSSRFFFFLTEIQMIYVIHWKVIRYLSTLRCRLPISTSPRCDRGEPLKVTAILEELVWGEPISIQQCSYWAEIIRQWIEMSKCR